MEISVTLGITVKSFDTAGQEMPHPPTVSNTACPTVTSQFSSLTNAVLFLNLIKFTSSFQAQEQVLISEQSNNGKEFL